MRVIVTALYCAVAFVAAACGSGSGTASQAPAIVGTTGIWADIAANLACDDAVEVASVIPAGADPHAFEASLADRRMVDDASLVVANGLGLEEGLEATIDDSAADRGTPVFTATDHMTTLGNDPHVWLDPARVAAALPALADAIAEVPGVDADTVATCLDRYLAEVEALDAEIVALVADVPEPRRQLITNHDSLAYFADRYGFEVIGTVVPGTSTLAEPNPADLDRLAELIERTDVPAIFTDAEESSRDAEALADRLDGVGVVPLTIGTLGDPASGASTYVELLRTAATTIVEALR